MSVRKLAAGAAVLLAGLGPMGALLVLLHRGIESPTSGRLESFELRASDGRVESIEPRRFPRLAILAVKPECPYCVDELRGLPPPAALQAEGIRLVVVSLGSPEELPPLRDRFPEVPFFSVGSRVPGFLRSPRVPLLLLTEYGVVRLRRTGLLPLDVLGKILWGTGEAG